ncbi:MAG: 4-hydroxy-tetrahydrodipicolinate reductase, partial [Oscillospiraceae bacterium]|nr:4-hydroxy-tetrahydrodipicolinate reductase [Oscillospiraceae bacterium]
MKVIVTGALGKMGGILADLVEKADGLELAAGVDAFSQGGEVLKSVADYSGKADMVIDFSHHSLTRELLDWCAEKRVPLVLCTTGHDEAEKAAIKAASEKTAIFFSANMSLGIALLCKMARETAKAFPDADIEIVEAHHNRKLDAPSGTALLIAEAIREARPEMNLV